MKFITQQQQQTDERSLVKVLVCLNCALIIVLFTVTYIQR